MYWEALPKSKPPKCKNYNTVVEGTKVELTLAKLEFFGDIASFLQNILSKHPKESNLYRRAWAHIWIAALREKPIGPEP